MFATLVTIALLGIAGIGMALFFAPVYVPLGLLNGWIETVAKANPLTYEVEASDPEGTALSFTWAAVVASA